MEIYKIIFFYVFRLFSRDGVKINFKNIILMYL
jgi:hypothetical protein